ncbi:MAG TPA: hypothetical protein VK639_19085 [Terriglobales bacterium]|nr:hypothetical protein [Terriglobales bacterium]
MICHGLKRLDAGGDGWNLVENAEARVDHFIRCESGVTNRDPFECAAVRDEHPVGANETVETRMKLVGAAAVVGID